MRYFLLTIISLVVTCLSWFLYNSADSLKFFIAFMGGGIDAFILAFMLLTKDVKKGEIL